MVGKSCFVIGPIGADDSEHRVHADWLYQGIILPVFNTYFSDVLVERADKITTPGMVNSQIINRLHDADLVVADLSFHNANAFYEMAIRHTVGKPIIHMIRKGENIPFDVIPHRAIQFLNTTPDEHVKARVLLQAAVTDAMKEGFEPENPVLHARGRLELLKNATPDQKIILQRLESAEARLNAIERPANALAGVITHEYIIAVRLEEAGYQAFEAFTDSFRAAFPELVPTSTGRDSCEIKITTTTKGAERVVKLIERLPLVQDVSPPMRVRPTFQTSFSS